MEKRLNNNQGKRTKVLMTNGFFFRGILLESSDTFFVIDDKKVGQKILRIEDIKELEFYVEDRE